MKRCFGCFNSINENEEFCPYCGYQTVNLSHPKWILPPGTILNGKYEIGRTLGEGGFGITYLAWDVNMETRVAIKEYYPATEVSRDVTSQDGNSILKSTSGHYENFEEGMKRYVKEAATLSKFFDLPGIVSVKDFFYENETAYIVMEFIDGESLKEFLKENGEKVSYNDALALVQPVISSLSVIHANKLLHRDISPDNIMIQYDGKIKLIDFGAARSIDQQQDNGMTVMLKHGYAPIEQYSRNGMQDAYTDVYGICAVLYRMITGNVPVESTDRVRQDTLIPIRKLVKKVPKHIATAIEKGLSVLPEARQQSMQELYNDLFITQKGLVDKKVDSAYSVLKKILIIVIIILLIISAIGVCYKLNYDKFENVREAVGALMGESPDDSEEAVKYIPDDENNDDAASVDEGVVDTDTVDESLEEDEATPDVVQPSEPEDLEEDTDSISDLPADDSNTQSLVVDDPEIDSAIEAVSQGYLSNNSRYSVGQILDNYSDYPGTWEGMRDSANEVYVKYTGSRSNESFAVIFHITSNKKSSTQVYISFELAGALKNNQKIDDYSDFFGEILSYS